MNPENNPASNALSESELDAIVGGVSPKPKPNRDEQNRLMLEHLQAGGLNVTLDMVKDQTILTDIVRNPHKYQNP